jgi:ATP-binding protein involved in chromosome partitioning
LLDVTRAIMMFRQLRVPVLGMIENMAFFDVIAYLKDRGGPEAHKLVDTKAFFDTPGDERVYIFGRGGARRRAEELGVPFLGEVPLNLYLRETGDEGKIEHALLSNSPARPHLLGVVEQLAAQISIQNIKAPKMPKLEILN